MNTNVKLIKEFEAKLIADNYKLVKGVKNDKRNEKLLKKEQKILVYMAPNGDFYKVYFIVEFKDEGFFFDGDRKIKFYNHNYNAINYQKIEL